MKPTLITYTCCSVNLLPMIYFLFEIFAVGIITELSHNKVLESQLCGYIIWSMLVTIIVDVVTVISVLCSWSVWRVSFSVYWLNTIVKMFHWYSFVTVIIPSGTNSTYDHNITICTVQPYFNELSIMSYIIIPMSLIMCICLILVSCLLAGKTIDPILNSYSTFV